LGEQKRTSEKTSKGAVVKGQVHYALPGRSDGMVLSNLTFDIHMKTLISSACNTILADFKSAPLLA
jgi:hypothetical protein